MTIDHLSKLDDEINRYHGDIQSDERQIFLLTENVKRNRKILKLLEEGREKMKETVKLKDANKATS